MLTDFTMQCLGFGGRLVGSSCFFVVDGLARTWTDCWNTVAQRTDGARMARMYTHQILQLAIEVCQEQSLITFGPGSDGTFSDICLKSVRLP